jgi:hypothetical protein
VRVRPVALGGGLTSTAFKLEVTAGQSAVVIKFNIKTVPAKIQAENATGRRLPLHSLMWRPQPASIRSQKYAAAASPGL